jgi:NADPH:quinone reductase-like Zn-dependent oxidoreductase
MAKMKAVKVNCAGGYFELVERDISEPGKLEVLVKVEACGICHGDAVSRKANSPGSNIRVFPAMKWWELLKNAVRKSKNGKKGQWYNGLGIGGQIIIVAVVSEPMQIFPGQLFRGGRSIKGLHAKGRVMP